MLSDIDLVLSQGRRDSEITLVDIEERHAWKSVDSVVVKHNELIETDLKDLAFFNYSSLASLVSGLGGTNESYRKNLRINPERLWGDIHYTAQWGAIEGSMGMARIAACEQDGKVRDWFVAAANAIGCEVRIDAIGNIFAILPSHTHSRSNAVSSLQTNVIAPIGMGSHLDTQPAGGRFDGILGCLAALEVLRTVKESGYQTHVPLAAICWTNEEGAGYISGCTGSSVWAGHQTLQTGHALPDSSTGTETLRDRLLAIKYGPTAAHYQQNPLTCHFEMHIEQGRRLQDAGLRAGIVERIQGIRWFRCEAQGQQGHAGSTPMVDRADALLATAKIQVLLDQLVREYGAVGTIGVVDAGSQASSNTIAGWASFTLDIRAPSEAIVEEIVKGVELGMKNLEAENHKLSFHLEQVWHSPAAEFDDEMLDCLRQAAVQETGTGGFMNMMSYAGHDSALTALRVPTAMLFIPCKDGVSHSPEEWSTKEQCADGTQVLLQAVLDYDHRLSMKKGWAP